MEHKFLIPKSYYVPSGGVRLLSPQHWAKTQQKNKNGKGAMSQTTSKDITLIWNEHKNKLVVPLSPENNVATFNLAPGYKRYNKFCCQVIANDPEWDSSPLISMEAPIRKERLKIPTKNLWTQNNNSKMFDSEEKEVEPVEVSWDYNHEKNNEFEIGTKDNTNSKGDENNISMQLLKIHNRFGHLSFHKLQIMAKQGILPKKYATCDIPVCAACSYAKIVKRSWRQKPNKNYQSKNILKPRELVSVDQMNSATPGLIAQMTGKLTIKRYKYATVFVDQASRLGYVQLQKSPDADETIKAKESFEAYMKTLGVDIKAYHADNGIFRANKWVNSCEANKQRLTFAGVNAHK